METRQLGNNLPNICVWLQSMRMQMRWIACNLYDMIRCKSQIWCKKESRFVHFDHLIIFCHSFFSGFFSASVESGEWRKLRTFPRNSLSLMAARFLTTATTTTTMPSTTTAPTTTTAATKTTTMTTACNVFATSTPTHTPTLLSWHCHVTQYCSLIGCCCAIEWMTVAVSVKVCLVLLFRSCQCLSFNCQLAAASG